MLGKLFGIACAVIFHVAVIAFAGFFFTGLRKDAGAVQLVEVLSPEQEAEQDKPKDPELQEKKEELETETETPPDAADIIRNLEIAQVDNTPALDAASLSAIEAALNGQGGGGDFNQALTFASGGRIGGTGKGGALDESLENAFNLTDIDQKPRAVFQAAPLYPAELRNRKLEGLVTVVFVVDASGKVVGPRVESSSLAAFDKPALDAVKNWKFEPALRGGKRVACKMRVPIRFQPR